MKKKLVILSGSGISAESGIPTFRGRGGVWDEEWEGYPLTEIASPEGWKLHPELVLSFYNQRRKNIMEKEPNLAHLILAELEQYFDVFIITQNIDDLHEKAGSTNIHHLHGIVRKVRSSLDENLIYDIDEIANSEGWKLSVGDKCRLGSQLRPHIVWFGENVIEIGTAIYEAMKAEIFVIVGTSLIVSPASQLIGYVPDETPKFIIDPKPPQLNKKYKNLEIIELPASSGMAKLKNILLERYQ